MQHARTCETHVCPDRRGRLSSAFGVEVWAFRLYALSSEYVRLSIVDIIRTDSDLRVRAVACRAKGARCDQITDSLRRSSLGALVLKLPGRIEDRRMAQNGEK